MLFDLKGRRRRVIQVTYLTLAVLMGGGLVLFGIGGDVQGGLIDAFTGEDSSSNANPIVEKRLNEAQARLRTNPNDQQALKNLTRSHFQLAGNDVNPDTGLYGPEARPELRRAASAWERYMATNPKPPDPSLARVMLQVYGEFGLNQPPKAAQTAEIVAEADPSASTFLALARYAAMAGDERKADLAGKRAVRWPRPSRRTSSRSRSSRSRPSPRRAAPRRRGPVGARRPRRPAALLVADFQHSTATRRRVTMRRHVRIGGR
jgi:hypothetical protein